MALEAMAERLIREVKDVAREGIRAATGLVGMVRGSGVLRAMTLEGLKAAAASAAAGDHPVAITLSLHAASHPEKPALVHNGEILTFGELLQTFNCLSHALADRGVAPGDRVLLMMGNNPMWCLAAGAVINCGAALVPVATGLKAASLAYIIEHARPRAIITDAQCWPAVAAHLTDKEALAARTLVLAGEGLELGGASPLSEALDAAPDHPLPTPEGRGLFPGLTLYTSGTTGRPKGVDRSDVGLSIEAINSVNGIMDAFGFSADDICYIPGPLYHAAPLFFMAAHLAVGATVILGTATTPEGMLADFDRWRVTTALLVPTLLGRLARHDPAPRPGDFPLLRSLFTTADRLPVAVAEEIRERFGDVLHDFYGSTETGLVTMANPRDLREHPGSIGRPLPGATIILAGEDGEEVPTGEEGELYARTGISMGGYRGDRDATQAAALKGLYTVGDRARRDASGYLYIVGRSAQLIISGGVNVYPAEIEAALLSHPAVDEVAVVGVPDDQWGEKVTALIVSRGDVTVGALRDWAAARLSKAQQPKDYRFWESLPVSPQGKINHKEIRRRLGAGDAPRAPSS